MEVKFLGYFTQYQFFEWQKLRSKLSMRAKVIYHQRIDMAFSLLRRKVRKVLFDVVLLSRGCSQTPGMPSVLSNGHVMCKGALLWLVGPSRSHVYSYPYCYEQCFKLRW
jgi:hypothetical protein